MESGISGTRATGAWFAGDFLITTIICFKRAPGTDIHLAPSLSWTPEERDYQPSLLFPSIGAVSVVRLALFLMLDQKEPRQSAVSSFPYFYLGMRISIEPLRQSREPLPPNQDSSLFSQCRPCKARF